MSSSRFPSESVHASAARPDGSFGILSSRTTPLGDFARFLGSGQRTVSLPRRATGRIRGAARRSGLVANRAPRLCGPRRAAGVPLTADVRGQAQDCIGAALAARVCGASGPQAGVGAQKRAPLRRRAPECHWRAGRGRTKSWPWSVVGGAAVIGCRGPHRLGKTAKPCSSRGIEVLAIDAFSGGLISMLLRPGIFEAPERIAERFNFPSFTYARHNWARNLKYRADRRGRVFLIRPHDPGRVLRTLGSHCGCWR